MDNIKLSMKECIPAARIFLNIFGLTLDDENNIKCNDKTVGNLFIVDDTITMKAEYNNATLDASFPIATGYGFVDAKENNALFGEWNFPIKFEAKSNNIDYDGEMLFTCTADSEFGLKCLIHPEINIKLQQDGIINVKIQKDFNFFRYEIDKKESNYHEFASVSPMSFYSYAMHQIKKGKKEGYSYPYDFQSGIFPGAEEGEKKDIIHVFLVEIENDGEEEKYLSFHNEWVQKVGEDDSKEVVIQKGLLMQELDKSMFEKIELIREILNIGNVSVLDNLVSVCYDSYSDEEVKALLGIDRQKLKYQDYSDNLIKAYFGNNVLSNEQITKTKSIK